jgi:hypothetical protein
MFVRCFVELPVGWEPVGLEGLLPRLDARLGAAITLSQAGGAGTMGS